MYSATAADTSAMACYNRDEGIAIEGFLGHRDY